MVSIMVVPAAVGAMIFCREVVVLVFGRGAFTHEAIEMTSKALFYYSIGMIGFGLIEVLTRAFYSLRDTKTPVRCTVVVVLANIVLNILLSRVMGIPGLALATSISGILGALVMSIYLRRRIGSFGLRTISLSFFKICIASLVMGLLARGSLTIANQVLHRNVALLVAIAVGALTYGLLIFNMRIPEVDRTWVAVKQRLVGLTDKNN
jgi:putative peptidoglycan lipid II flippase